MRERGAKVTRAWAIVDYGKLDCWDERLPVFWLKHVAVEVMKEESCPGAEVIPVEIRPVKPTPRKRGGRKVKT